MSEAAAVSVVETTPDVNPSEEFAPASTAVTPAEKKKAPKKGVRTEAKPAASGNKKGGTRTATPAAAKIPVKNPVNREAYKRYQQLADTFKHLGSNTRVALVEFIADQGPVKVGSMAVHLDQSQPAVSHHLALLRHGGILESARNGKEILYSLTAKGKDLAGIVAKYGEKMDAAAAKAAAK